MDFYTKVGIYLRITPTDNEPIRSCPEHVTPLDKTIRYCQQCGLPVEDELDPTEHNIRQLFDDDAELFFDKGDYLLMLMLPPYEMTWGNSVIRIDKDIVCFCSEFERKHHRFIKTLKGYEQVKDITVEYGVISRWS